MRTTGFGSDVLVTMFGDPLLAQEYTLLSKYSGCF